MRNFYFFGAMTSAMLACLSACGVFAGFVVGSADAMVIYGIALISTGVALRLFLKRLD